MSTGQTASPRPFSLGAVDATTKVFLAADAPEDKISPKFQLVTPRAIREQLGLTPSQKVQPLAYANRIELTPVQPLKRMRGFLRGGIGWASLKVICMCVLPIMSHFFSKFCRS